MKEIWQANVHHLTIGMLNDVIQVIIPVKDMVFCCKCFRLFFLSCVYGHHFCFGYKTMIAFHMDVCDKTSSQYRHFSF